MLKVGYMLYFSEKLSLEEKLRLVIRYYSKKAERQPDFIVLNTSEKNAPEKFDGVDILTRKWITRNYFWVGVYG